MLSEILNFKKYVTSNVGVKCFLGVEDTDQSDYIRILPSAFSFDVMNRSVVGTNYPVTLEITVDKDNTIGGIELLEKLVKCINSYDYYSGSELQEEGTPEYTENDFIIRIGFNLKTIIQES